MTRQVNRLLPLLALTLSGCASVGTFIGQTSDLASGGPAQREREATARQQDAYAQNISLQNELASLNRQKAGLHTALGQSRSALDRVNARLAQSRTATQAQRDEYSRLVAAQRDLQRRLDAASTQPPPADAAAAASQKAELDRLTAQKDVLRQQVEALSKGLAS